MILVWRITDDSPNLPTFPPAKVSLHTVYCKKQTECLNEKILNTTAYIIVMYSASMYCPSHYNSITILIFPKCQA